VATEPSIGSDTPALDGDLKRREVIEMMIIIIVDIWIVIQITALLLLQ